MYCGIALLGLLVVSTICFSSQVLASSNGNGLRTVELSDANIPIESILAGNVTSESKPGFVFLNRDNGTVQYGLSSFWQDRENFCNNSLTCSEDSTTGFGDNSSIKLSTNVEGPDPCLPNALPCSFAWIYGGDISGIEPGQNYNVISHMKLNEHVVLSHLAIDGFNESSQNWNRLILCPVGTNGPLNWSRFTCELTIPQNTSLIRPQLLSGWSSSPGSDATTWFDNLYIVSNNTIGNNTPTRGQEEPRIPFLSN